MIVRHYPDKNLSVIVIEDSDTRINYGNQLLVFHACECGEAPSVDISRKKATCNRFTNFRLKDKDDPSKIPCTHHVDFSKINTGMTDPDCPESECDYRNHFFRSKNDDNERNEE